MVCENKPNHILKNHYSQMNLFLIFYLESIFKVLYKSKYHFWSFKFGKTLTMKIKRLI